MAVFILSFMVTVLAIVCMQIDLCVPSCWLSMWTGFQWKPRFAVAIDGGVGRKAKALFRGILKKASINVVDVR